MPQTDQYQKAKARFLDISAELIQIELQLGESLLTVKEMQQKVLESILDNPDSVEVGEVLVAVEGERLLFKHLLQKRAEYDQALRELNEALKGD
jgi:hypothetical protein